MEACDTKCVNVSTATPDESIPNSAVRRKRARVYRADPIWTPEELQRLDLEFSESAKRGLMKKFPDRSWYAIYKKARERGLHGMQGLISATRAAAAIGIARTTLMRLCERASTSVQWHGIRGPNKYPQVRMVYAEPDDVATAYADYELSETIAAAAVRHGVNKRTLAEKLVRAGIHRVRTVDEVQTPVRLSPIVYDKVLGIVTSDDEYTARHDAIVVRTLEAFRRPIKPREEEKFIRVQCEHCKKSVGTFTRDRLRKSRHKNGKSLCAGSMQAVEKP